MKKFRPKQFLEAYSTDLQNEIMTCGLTFADFWEMSDDEAPKLYTVKEAYSMKFCVSFVQAHLIRLNAFVGVRDKFNDLQFNDLAVEIINQYGYFNVYELILFFARFRAGRYESLYGSMDPMKIVKSLEQFKEERWIAVTKRENENRKREEEAMAQASQSQGRGFASFAKSMTPERIAELREIHGDQYVDDLLASIEFYGNILKYNPDTGKCGVTESDIQGRRAKK